ncbi:polyketide synthase, partial [Moorena sp. SIO2C4]
MAELNLNRDLGTSNSEVVQLTELGNGVVQITMKDESSRNGFSPSIVEGLRHCFSVVAQNQQYKVVILTGYGNYFSSGASKEYLIRKTRGEVEVLDLSGLILDCEIPIIAAMQGHSFGGGLLLGLYADFVVFSQESVYATNFMKYGFTPVGATSLILREKLGSELAQEMIYTGENYRGKELAERGIPFPVVSRQDVLNYAQQLGQKIAKSPRLSLVALKQHLSADIKAKFPEAIKKELEIHQVTFNQPEIASRIQQEFGETVIPNLIQSTVEQKIPNPQPVQLRIPSYGLLKNLTWMPQERRKPKSTEVEVQIKAVPVNFREVLNVLGIFQEYIKKRYRSGIISAENLTFGVEGVGTVVAVGSDVSQWKVGDEVILAYPGNAFSSFVICSPDDLLAKPSDLSMVEAATIFMSFFTAYYGLHNLAKVQPGERVLIHAASGGAGQAAVQLAQFFGSEVFATTSPHKISVLREQGIKHVMNSRTTEFASEVRELTQGNGVDVIFNSLTHGEYIPKNIDILAPGGRYIEIGRLNIWSHEQVSQRRPDVKYFPFDMSDEFVRDKQFHAKLWDDLALLFESGSLKPLPYKVFPSEDVVEAFRHLQHSKHIGKIVVTMPELYNGVKNSSQQANQESMSHQEELLHQLQSGDISLENAEQLLLGLTDQQILATVPNNGQNKLINTDKTEQILSLLSSGEISLENAQNLLETVDLNSPTKKNLPTAVPNQGQSNQDEAILNQLQSGEVSLEDAEQLLLEIQQKESVTTKSIPDQRITDDIAIIGISCRYPGAKNWKEFWENLKHGVDSVTEPPPGRWEGRSWYHSDPEHPGTACSKYAAFLDDIDKFDPLFFQISPGEAELIEPQQRIFLEEAYHAIEDAGYAPDSLKGKHCGVFVGAASSDYIKFLSNSGFGHHRLVLSGTMLSVLPARIAYFLDLKGPVVAVEAACSSSLVAVHQACESIKRGESEIAIAGGISTMLTPDFQVLSSQFQMVSPEGRCKSFDAEASGIVWGEGCGAILLKRYEQAVQDQDHIYGIIKGTGTNYDGSTNGISAPSSKSQARLAENIYQQFGINPETISYLEAHGTATPLGDPIEVEAFTEAFSKWTAQKQFCAIGSVKTNIGNAATAAGMSSLIKTILCLKNQKLVPSLHFNQPNPNIDFANSPFYVNTEFKAWEVPTGIPRRAAVNSFGLNGTNAHVVVEEAPIEDNRQTSPVSPQGGKATGNSEDYLENSVHLLTLSAKTETALGEVISSYQNYLKTNPNLRLGDVCYTASTGRTHFTHRLAVVAPNQQELVEKLRQHQEGKKLAGITSGELLNNTTVAKIAFLFTGQGSQYINMGKQLYQQAPTFRQAINQCEEILSSVETFQETSLRNILYPTDKNSSGSSLLGQTAYTQPALFAIEYALFKLWQSWGIEPDVVMGHSVGEYVAATVAGVFSLEDGLKLIAARGSLMQKLPGDGKMLWAMAPESKVLETLKAKDLSEKVAIAAINGPQSIVISGEGKAVEAIATNLESAGITTKPLKVSHAFHSPLMEPMLAEFEAAAKEITYEQPRIPLISNVTGKQVTEQITTAEYWVNHVRQPVQFAQSMKTLYQEGYELFLEIGPKPVLLSMGRQCLPEKIGVWLPSLRPGVEECQQMLSSLGKLYVEGAKVDWIAFEQNYARQKVALPTYPFQRERYWVSSQNGYEQKSYWLKGKEQHPLLGEKINLAGIEDQHRFQSYIGAESPGYLNHHQVFGKVLFPSTGYLEIAASAGKSLFTSQEQVVVSDVDILQSLVIPETEIKTVQTVVSFAENNSYKFEIFSPSEGENQQTPQWVLHAQGKIYTEPTRNSQAKIDLEKYQAECSQAIEIEEHYREYRSKGIDYGSSFQGIKQLWKGQGKALGEMAFPEELTAQLADYQLHPALLDAAFQIVSYAIPHTETDKIYLPVGVEKFKLYRQTISQVWAIAEIRQTNLTANIFLVDNQGTVLVELEGLRVKVTEPVLTQKSAFKEQLKSASVSERQELLTTQISSAIVNILGLRDGQQIERHQPLFDLGLDSLMAVELKNQLESNLGTSFSSTLLFDYPTVESLVEYLANNVIPIDSFSELPTLIPHPEQRYQPFPLNDIQQAYWIGRNQIFDLGNIATHIYIEVDCENLNLESLHQAWRRLIDHHDMLRMVVLADGNQQILEQVPPYEIEILNLSEESPETIASELEQIRNQMSHEVLPTNQWPLFHLRATRLNEQCFRLHASIDMLIFDAWSTYVLFKQWSELYNNPQSSLPATEISFRDYVLAELELKDSPQYLSSQQYWFNRLDNLPPAPEIPQAKVTSAITDPQFNTHTAQLSQSDWQQLKNKASKANLTPSGVLLSAFASVLNYWSKSSKFTLNLTLFNRLPLHPQVNELIGDFTSVILLEVDNSQAVPFISRAQKLQRQLWEDLEHRYISGVEVQRELYRRGRSQPMGVVFTSTLGLKSLADEEVGRGFGLEHFGEVVYSAAQTPQVLLDHIVTEEKGALAFSWHTVEGLFPEGLIEQMFEAYCDLLQQLATSDEPWMETYHQLLPTAQLALQAQVNQTTQSWSEDILHSLFVKQVQVQSEATAVISPQKSLTYGELYQRSHQLGHGLRKLGVKPNQLVAVVMEKGWEQVVAVLGILMSGGAYLPIDPGLPQERQWYLLEQAQVTQVLTQT